MNARMIAAKLEGSRQHLHGFFSSLQGQERFSQGLTDLASTGLGLIGLAKRLHCFLVHPTGGQSLTEMEEPSDVRKSRRQLCCQLHGFIAALHRQQRR